MEKIKNLLKPGKDQDDEILYGSGSGGPTSTKPHKGGLSGEGSHFASAKEPSTGLAGQQTSEITNTHGSDSGLGHTSNLGTTQDSGTHPSTATSPHSSKLANKADPRADSDNSRIADSSGGYTGTSSRDAELIAGGADLTRRENQQYGTDNTGSLGDTQGGGIQSSTTAGPHSSNLANKADVDSGNSRATGSGVAGSRGGYTSTSGGSYHTGSSGSAVTSGPHHTDTSNRLDPSVNTISTRVEDDDAAIRLGGAGAAGVTAYQYNKHQTDSDRRLGDSANIGQPTTGYATSSTHDKDEYSVPGAYPSGPGPAPTTAGPHKYDVLNKLDPRVKANPETSPSGTEYKSGSAANPAQPGVQSRQYNEAGLSDSGHQAVSGIPERSRAIDDPHSSAVDDRADQTRDQYNDSTPKDRKDAAIAGGAGGAAYGASRQHQAHATSTAGPHSSDSANHADLRVDNDRPKDRQHGVGVAGYGASKQDETPSQGVTTQTTTHTSTSTFGPHSSNIANKADPTVESDRSKDAAVAGGLGGAAAYGAHKYSERDEKDAKKAEKEHEREAREAEKDAKKAEKEHEREAKEAEKDRKHSEKEAEKDRKHAEKEAEKDRKHAEKEHEKHEKKEHKGGLLSFLHRDKNKKYSKEEEDEFDRQERDHNSHKDAAIGSGAGAAVGGGAYAAQQHHSDHNTTDTDTNKPLPTAPGNHGIGTGSGTQNALASENLTGHHDMHGDHSTSSTTEHHGPIPLTEKPPGTDIGDKLHGVERNRGVQGPTGFPHETLGEHNTDQYGNPVGGSTPGERSRLGGDNHSAISGQHDGTASGSGLDSSRDAAILGGGAEAGAPGAHEYGKHDSATSGHQSGRHYDNTNTHSSGLSGSRPLGEHDTTRDGSVIGGGGAGSGQQPGPGSSGYTDSSRQTGGIIGSQYDDSSNTTGGLTNRHEGGRNRLHKDPPADHPAAQGTA